MPTPFLRTLSAAVLAAAFLVPAGCVHHAGATPPQAHHTPQNDDATARHSFADVERWVEVFDDPQRDAWQRPAEVVAALDLRPGMSVADIGAGTGYFAHYLSAAVGERGTVFAVDTEPNLVVHLRRRAESEATANVIPVLASADNPRLPAAAVDVVMLVDTIHHIDHRVDYLRRLRPVLRPAGRVAVIDFRTDIEIPVGPPPDHRLARGKVVAEMREAGYELIGEPQILPYQYFLVFR